MIAPGPDQPPPAAAPLLQMRGVHKSFPGVHALRGVDLTLQRGQVLALVGENGAGKSTLIKVLAGVHQPDAGELRIDGQLLRINNPVEGRRAGVSVIYQEFNLVPDMSAAENLFLGREPGRFGITQPRREREQTQQLLHRLGVNFDPSTRCRDLTVAQQQTLEIAKALADQARIIVMDEPSAALTQHEVERLFELIEDLKSRGIGIIYISHRIDEIFRIADRVTVLRDGAHVATEPIENVTRAKLIEQMVGRKLENEFPKQRATIGEARLVARNLRRGARLRGVSLQVRRGEVLALAGLVGAGRTELVRLLFGADRPESGSIELDGKPLVLKHPRHAIRAGICLLTEDRKAQGLVLGLSVRENFALPNLGAFSTAGVITRGRERAAFARYVKSLNIRIPHQEQLARNLSGGNQQKVVLAKWLQRNAEVIIFDEPTRGIDVGAKYEVYLLMNELAAAGKAIIMVSSELPEVLGMADRILVMHEGVITGQIDNVAAATQADVMRLAVQ